MFAKILIANRGVIATRIIRTLNSMNVASVAIYAESDANSLHVRYANESHSLGEGSATDTYLNIDKVIAVAKASGAQAIHPGYGFLSENAAFVARCEQEGIVFIGPTAEQMGVFGLKHKARELAEQAQVPLLPGSDLLTDLGDAITQANAIGYPVMLKSTAGGGGIGMQLCHTQAELESCFDAVKRLGANNFADDSVFLEKFVAKARHIEVQVMGDGQGNASAIGERDCSSQRRNQKVVEECPAPNIPEHIRHQLWQTAEALLASVNYRNLGTVEFIYDDDSHGFYFLEVNTRLQVEHGVTEEVYGLDLVEQMLKIAANEATCLDELRSSLSANGHAIQVRVYAEDPYRDFQPCPGLLTHVDFPKGGGIRIDTWVEAGVEVPPYFDPMLAKVIVHAESREQALTQLHTVLTKTQLYGGETNLDYLTALTADPVLAQGRVTTRYLNDFVYTPNRIDVVQGGTQTTIQDYPARTGYWSVGVPPSGPFDTRSFRLANRLLANPEDAAGLEIAIQGPTLRFSQACQVVVTGADIDAELDGHTLPLWQVVDVAAGQTLKLGRIKGSGARSYLAVSGGIQCPDYLGSKSTFTLGQFGGHNGRGLQTGDVLRLSVRMPAIEAPKQALELAPIFSDEWQLRVIYGPHGAPDFFTNEDIKTFFDHTWEVHYNSSRTGVRLIGPKPEWARKDGGEAGLHPSNIHDNAYAFGTVDFTGDMPVILGPDGPSLGGFVCPATVVQADLWKLGQLRAGDKVRFVPITLDQAKLLELEQNQAIASLNEPILLDECLPKHTHKGLQIDAMTPVLDQLSVEQYGVEVTYRAAGDHFLLIEYGDQVLDLKLRLRAHALMQWLEKNGLDGIQEITPGIRSLQIHYDSQVLSHLELIAHLKQGEAIVAAQLDQVRVPSRIVHIPLSWDDEACQLAIDKYQQSVRSNAPWCPSNLEFIRRINGLDSIDAIKDIVFNASYLVMGLGDVYLGAPVATPVDPRHRLVTTKYNPARTWTAENSVGIGGSYLCVYGMEGPGGYQFIGRTLQMWNRYRQTAEFDEPWLLRFFDQIRFYEVSNQELEQIRKDFPCGRYPLKIEESYFSMSEYNEMIRQSQGEIDSFTQVRQQAFDQELANWHATGQFNFEVTEEPEIEVASTWPEGSLVLDSPVSGSLWQADVTEGQHVKEGDVLLILESMKMEIPVYATASGTVTNLLVKGGQRVSAGQALVVIKEEE